MYTDHKLPRMSIREFRASLKSDVPLPVIATADGHDAFAVVPFPIPRDLLDRAKAHEAQCPFCGITAEPKPIPGEAVQAQCGNCRSRFRWVM